MTSISPSRALCCRGADGQRPSLRYTHPAPTQLRRHSGLVTIASTGVGPSALVCTHRERGTPAAASPLVRGPGAAGQSVRSLVTAMGFLKKARHVAMAAQEGRRIRFEEEQLSNIRNNCLVNRHFLTPVRVPGSCAIGDSIVEAGKQASILRVSDVDLPHLEVLAAIAQT